MRRVIDDISDWVKVSVGKLELSIEPVLLDALLKEVVRALLHCRCCGGMVPLPSGPLCPLESRRAHCD